MKYKGAIIGLGFIGGADQVSGDALGQRVEDLDGTHFFAMLNHPQVELIAGSSRDRGRRDRFAARTSARVYADWREMLDRESPDIVSVAAYAPQHAEMTVACAERGVRAIYCEKPIATKLADAERMLAACRKSGSLLAINHNRRFQPHFRRLRSFVAEGGLGELTSVSIAWGSGRLGNVGTHMFNAAAMLVGRRVEAVSAALDLSQRPDCRGAAFQDPGGWGMLRYEEGLMGIFDAGDYSQAPAAITLNGANGRAIAGAGGVTLEFWDEHNEVWPNVGGPETSMDRAMAEIVAWLDGVAEFADPAENSLHTLETIIACHASHRRNSAWTHLPLASADREIEVRSG
ncbi:MAG TPA: Gfo/Idh/MocA family oxidoreductase [Pirellulales bacterium]|nr:Gfo/Idh/MocA family oxidoreductase [Pirellulales bacterium]